jgi:hypothetical protein
VCREQGQRYRSTPPTDQAIDRKFGEANTLRRRSGSGSRDALTNSTTGRINFGLS